MTHTIRDFYSRRPHFRRCDAFRGTIGQISHAGNDRLRAHADTLAIHSGSPARQPPGLHRGQPEPGDPSARHPHGAGDGAGVALCGGRRLLCQPPRSERDRHRWPDRVGAHSGLCGRPGAEHVDDRDGRAPHRRERRERRGRLRSPGYFPGTYRFVGDGPSLLPASRLGCWP